MIQKVEFLDPGMLFLSRGKLDSGEQYWAYVMVPEGKLMPYLEAKFSGNPYDVSEYGHILCWGKGKNPPEKVKADMKEAYNTQDNLAENFIKDLEATKDGQRFITFLREHLEKNKQA